MADWIDLLQWPAMAVTLLAAFLVGSNHQGRRIGGFAAFVVSNVLWISWGLHDGAWALIALQAGLFLTNLRGIRKSGQGQASTAAAPVPPTGGPPSIPVAPSPPSAV
ncbi:hypothetical protein [Massilia sp. PWRC2]|uniref:hypothetical protein n=1 Tax=Massilia sp. PWRC2 TaxID=2804626 RepID=UPI003CEFF528